MEDWQGVSMRGKWEIFQSYFGISFVAKRMR